MTRSTMAAAALLLAATAAPALAQSAPPPPAPGAAMEGRGPHRMDVKRFGRDGGRGGMGSALAGLSPEGRKVLGDAMRDARGEGPDAVGQARQKVLELLDADRLDVGAVRRAMAEEHSLVERKQQARQEAMLAAYQKLSVRDRKAFAASMRAQTYRMEQMRKDTETRMSKMRGQWGKPDMPPPPPPAR